MIRTSTTQAGPPGTAGGRPGSCRAQVPPGQVCGVGPGVQRRGEEAEPAFDVVDVPARGAEAHEHVAVEQVLLDLFGPDEPEEFSRVRGLIRRGVVDRIGEHHHERCLQHRGEVAAPFHRGRHLVPPARHQRSFQMREDRVDRLREQAHPTAAPSRGCAASTSSITADSSIGRLASITSVEDGPRVPDSTARRSPSPLGGNSSKPSSNSDLVGVSKARARMRASPRCRLAEEPVVGDQPALQPGLHLSRVPRSHRDEHRDQPVKVPAAGDHGRQRTNEQVGLAGSSLPQYHQPAVGDLPSQTSTRSRSAPARPSSVVTHRPLRADGTAGSCRRSTRATRPRSRTAWPVRDPTGSADGRRRRP